MPQTSFGPHLTIDAYEVGTNKLGDKNLIYEFLSSLPSKIRMTKIMEPNIISYDGGKKPEDWGISGFVIIAESHISIHTFPAKKYLSIDIFSCKEFDIEEAINTVKNVFSINKIETNFLWHGKEFPKT
jgi:S-adenosylmethionine decarboxylase